MSDSDAHENNKYDRSIVDHVTLLYTVAIVFWIVLIFILDLYRTDAIGSLILIIPIIYMLISMNKFEECDTKIEEELDDWDILPLGVVIITVFLTLKHPEYTTFFYRLIFVGVLLVALGMMDLWLPRKHLILHKHFRTILEILSTTIFVYIFYVFYFIYSKRETNNRNPFVDLGECFR